MRIPETQRVPNADRSFEPLVQHFCQTSIFSSEGTLVQASRVNDMGDARKQKGALEGLSCNAKATAPAPCGSQQGRRQGQCREPPTKALRHDNKGLA